MFSPRGWQVAANEALDAFDASSGRHPMVVACTGSGKTAFATWRMVRHARRGLWIAHRKELFTQPLDTLNRMFPGHDGGLVWAGHDDVAARFVYASKDTLIRGDRLDRVLAHGHPDFVVIDEAHRSMSPTYLKVIERLVAGGSRLLGLTATPDREDGADLSRLWEIAFAYGIVDALEDGVLIPPYAAVHPIPELDLSSVGGRKDYIESELEAQLLKAHIVEHTVEAARATYAAERLPFRDDTRQMSIGQRSTLLFTATVEQARLTSDALRAAGLESRYVHGGTPDGERRRLLSAFRSGDIQFLCNPAVLTEGTDLPVASAVMLARPTKSWSLFVQTVGRALRTHEDQDAALVLDLAGGITRVHSLIAAPALVRTGCPESEDGLHRYLRAGETSEGICEHCKHTVKCADRGGAHRFVDGACVSCGSPACGASPDGSHEFVRIEYDRRGCIHCGLELPDRTASLVGKSAHAERLPAAWKRLSCPGEVYAAPLGKIGTLYQVRRTNGFMPMWVAGGRLIRLARQEVAPEHCTLLCSDVLRKAGRVDGLWGGKPRAKDYKDAERVARTLLLWRG